MRAQVGVGFAVVGWFRRFRPAPPHRWFFFLSVGLRFSFLLPFQGFARSGPGVLVWVFALSLFFCVPLLVSRLGKKIYFIFTFISSSLPSSSSPPPHCKQTSVCVCNVWINVKLRGRLIFIYYIFLQQGITGVPGGRWSTKTAPRDPCARTCWALVVHLGAFKSQLVATIAYIYIHFAILVIIYIYNL